MGTGIIDTETMVIDLKSAVLKVKFIAPMPEVIAISTLSENIGLGPTSRKCIVGVLICSGMGAMNFNLWVHRSLTI